MISVVIPVHNEGREGARWLAALRRELDGLPWPYEVLVVENGSTDGTPALLAEWSAAWPQLRVIHVPEACYGAALKAGMQAARGELIVNFDLDFWDVHLVHVAQALVPLGYEIIIGSKLNSLSSDARPWLRRLVSWGFRLVLGLLFRLPASDTHGIKVWAHTGALQAELARVPATHHVCDTELVIRRIRAGARVIEVPISVRETRAVPRSILRRIPRALGEVIGLYWRLRRG
ncbi:MAG: glycosyltransferase family 2 protein [bacterium]|nr:glycosyltransferase family 2 protein [bacterium]